MTSTRLLVVPLASLAMMVGCGDDDAAALPTAVVRFQAPASGAIDFADLPFPSDAYVDAAGQLELGAVPTPRTDDPMFADFRAMLAPRGGFCGTCNAYFRIDGMLDPTSVPPSATPTDVASAADAIVLVEVGVTPARFVPLRTQWDARAGLLAVRPVRGVVLGRGTRWALGITSRLRAEDGTPLGASPVFRQLRDGATVEGDAIASRLAPTTRDAITALVGAGVPRDRLVAATSFGVSDPTRDLVAVRAAVHGAPVPSAVINRVYPGPDGTLDELLGVPSEMRPGIDVPPAAGTEGSRSLGHADVAWVVLGRIRAPRILTGAGTEVGTPNRDASGTITAGPIEDVPFVLAVPRGADVTRLPLMVVHHGFNASRTTALTLADTAARAGVAVLGIDAFQHGARALVTHDEIHDMRGTAGADGFAETEVTSVSARTFGITGPPMGYELFPGYPLGAFLQFAADAMSAIRFVREGDPAPLRAVDTSLAALAFDPAHVFYLGISLGSVIGASVLTVETDLRGMVLLVPPGSIVDTLCEGSEFRIVTSTLLAPLLRIDGRFDDVTHACLMDPIVDLFRFAIEPTDPLALAPAFLRAPVAMGVRPDVMWLAAANDEIAAPTATEAMLAAAGVPGVGGFTLAPVPAPDGALPVSANFTTPSGPVTALAIRLEPGTHLMPEIARDDSRYELPLVPPLRLRPMPIDIDNPIVALHAKVEQFLRTQLATGHAVVE